MTLTARGSRQKHPGKECCRGGFAQHRVALLHGQPTQSSIAAAEETLVDVWLPMETAVAALSRAREADRANDRIACEEALAEVQRVIGR